jgi:hypothetical protein
MTRDETGRWPATHLAPWTILAATLLGCGGSLGPHPSILDGGLDGGTGDGGAGDGGPSSDADVPDDASTDGGPIAAACLPGLDVALAACVARGEARVDRDPDREFLVDLLLGCADPEVVAPFFDAYCAATPAASACEGGLEAFVARDLPACVEAARQVVFEGRCVLPAKLEGFRFSPWLVELGTVRIDGPAMVGVGSAREAQLLSAIAVGGRPASSLPEALAATDDGSFEVSMFLDVGSRRSLDVVTALVGGERYGRVFFAGTSFAVADIVAGDRIACAVEIRPEGTPCTDGASCGAGTCLGVVREEVCDVEGCTPAGPVVAEGRCTGTRRDEARPAEGALCAEDLDCPAADGLACIRLGDAPEAIGFCDDAWLRRRFAFDGGPLDGLVTRIPLVVSGVATVSLRSTLSAVVRHPRPAQLRISIEHPGGGSATVVFEDSGATGDLVALADVPLALPSDEGINGTWMLIVEDLGAAPPLAGSASISGIELSVRSWFD